MTDINVDTISDAAIRKAIEVLACGWSVSDVRAQPRHYDSYREAIISVAAFCEQVDAAARLADEELIVDGIERAPQTSDATARRALQALMIDAPMPKLGEGVLTTSGGWLDVNALIQLLKEKGLTR